MIFLHAFRRTRINIIDVYVYVYVIQRTIRPSRNNCARRLEWTFISLGGGFFVPHHRRRRSAERILPLHDCVRTFMRPVRENRRRYRIRFRIPATYMRVCTHLGTHLQDDQNIESRKQRDNGDWKLIILRKYLPICYIIKHVALALLRFSISDPNLE